MRQALRFTVALVAGLALLTWAASVLVRRTTRGWFERDMQLRAQLAVSGAGEALVSHWAAGQEPELRKVLVELSRDERIMGAAACGPDLRSRTQTFDYPPALSCAEIGVHVRPAADSPAASWTIWAAVFSVRGGQVYATAVPVVEGEAPLGFVVLVHDLSFVERREATTRRFIALAFGILAFAASVITLVAARLSWLGWSNELRRLIRGGSPPPEFRPFLRDVRDLVERLAAEREADGLGGLWTPQRLKNTLSRHLHGERVVAVANREPYIHERGADGRATLVHPASGLVTALEPVMRACSGVWIAHGSGAADREAADPRGRLRVPPGEESYVLRRVWLSPDEERGYYYGFSNEGLWPLCHIAHTRPIFRSEDWRLYQEVNRRFADAVSEEVDSADPILLVQDYHFALLPRMIRERLPRATVITFWHIPWPNSEQFGICPWRDEILAGLLGSSILGFHTQFHCNNFIDGVDRFLESRIDREQNAVVHQGQRTLVRPYPISIEWPSGWLRTAPSVPECRAGVFADLRLPRDALLGVGVDRLDYTKGIEERLLAVERLLERSPPLRGRFTFVQLAAPSRTVIPQYRQVNEIVERVAARINERFAEGDYRPVILRRAHHEPPEVFRYYRAADVCYVSSLHDGMNLVAKEFVAARDDERGVLVLSHFTGAARELTEALSVNPYDLEEASAALSAALQMPADEQRDRMRAMRTLVAEFNVYRWAGRMLVDAARLRRRERLSGRFRRLLPEPAGAAS
ncbi:MAG TPA: trehalose-6-phosphate synthase [Vicinamibacteria bacterium]|nr:trehalose-6-phosphate synthase [Vicinamibacteria bacterium]